MVRYVPNSKDIVTIDFSPTKGHEQNGSRPALVISSRVFNNFTHMAIVCPITTNNKDFPTHYKLESPKIIKGSVLCEHIRSIDYDERNVKLIDTISDTEYQNILELIKSFYEFV